MRAGKAPTKMTQSTLALSSGGQGVEIRPAAAPRRRPGPSLGVKPKRTKPTVQKEEREGRKREEAVSEKKVREVEKKVSVLW